MVRDLVPIRHPASNNKLNTKIYNQIKFKSLRAKSTKTEVSLEALSRILIATSEVCLELVNGKTSAAFVFFPTCFRQSSPPDPELLDELSESSLNN